MNRTKNEDLTNGLQPSQVLKRKSGSNIPPMTMKVKPVFPQSCNTIIGQRDMSSCDAMAKTGTGNCLPEMRRGVGQ